MPPRTITQSTNGTVVDTSRIPVNAFIAMVRFTGTDYRHLWHISLARKMPIASMRRGEAPTSTGQDGAIAGMSTTSSMQGYDDHPHMCMTCPCCSNVITCGFLECLVCETQNFYDVTGPPLLNVLSNPESAR